MVKRTYCWWMYQLQGITKRFGADAVPYQWYQWHGTTYILSFRIRSGKIPNFLSVWMKSMMIQMWKAKDVLSLLHFFKKIQTEDETNTNY